MTHAELFTALETLEARGFERLTSRRKPLALLWAISRIAAGQSRLIEWRDFRDGMPLLQERYARPLQTPDPQYPFWDLRSSVLWEVVGDRGHLESPDARTPSWLDANNPSAGLTLDVATLLKDPAILSRAVRTLLSRFFFDVDNGSLLADLGLAGHVSFAGPLRGGPPPETTDNELDETFHNDVTAEQPPGFELQTEISPGTATPPQDFVAPVDAVQATTGDPALAAGRSSDGGLVCEAALRGLDSHVKRTVVVVETRSDGDAGIFGFAWLTEDGELRTGTERSSEAQDNAIQAMCLAALDLDDGSSPIHVVCRDAKAANVVSRVLRSGSLRDPSDIVLAVRTRELLLEVARRRGRISAAWDPCPDPHGGAAATWELADLALRAAQGLESMAAVRAAADRMSQEFSNGVGAELTSPEEEDDHAWWGPHGGPGPGKRAELVWQAALYRMHLDGGWCPLPPGRVDQKHDGRRLRLRIDHRDRVHSQLGPEHGVTLRRRAGEWELHGIRWPAGLRPGVIVAFAWQTAGSHVTARTALLRTPERVDGVEFLHQYDARVVTREAAPGSDQDRDVPDISDASWVLRTLRKLGYLSPDGSATLAEDALGRNCLRLGIPRSYLRRLPAAVEQLERSGRIQRVQGSLDRYGRPWYPARAGHLPAELLRYVPSVEAVDRSVRREIQDAWHRQRDTHWVSGFVRRLPPGAQASAEQIDLHREAVEAAEIVDEWLPEGYTFVRRHRRGGPT